MKSKGGQNWMPITPLKGSILHAETQFLRSEGKTFKKTLVASEQDRPRMARFRARWKTLTFLAGLRRDGIVAPFVLDGPINGIAFTAWVQQCLVPTLATGDVVILDNLGSHKGKPARDAIRDVGAHLFFLLPTTPISTPSK